MIPTRCIQPVHYSLITEDSISASTMQSQADNKIKANSMTTSSIDHSLNIKGPGVLPQNPIPPSSKHARDHSRISILESCRWLWISLHPRILRWEKPLSPLRLWCRWSANWLPSPCFFFLFPSDSLTTPKRTQWITVTRDFMPTYLLGQYPDRHPLTLVDRYTDGSSPATQARTSPFIAQALSPVLLFSINSMHIGDNGCENSQDSRYVRHGWQRSAAKCKISVEIIDFVFMELNG